MSKNEHEQIEVMPERVLLLMVGLPRSGKSTTAATLSRMTNAPIVCPDQIRLALHGETYNADREQEVWSIAHVMVEALFRAGHGKVIVDATNNTQKRRLDWLKHAARMDATPYVYILGTDAATCKQRALDGGRDELIPIIERMDEQADWKDYPAHNIIRADLIETETPATVKAILAEKGVF